MVAQRLPVKDLDPATAAAVARALRRIRPTVFKVGHEDRGTTIALRVTASASGRRNAAARILTALAAGGLALAADDPIETLAAGGEHLVVRRAG